MTRGSGWRACLRAQTTPSSCRRPRTPRGAASPPPASPQVRAHRHVMPSPLRESGSRALPRPGQGGAWQRNAPASSCKGVSELPPLLPFPLPRPCQGTSSYQSNHRHQQEKSLVPPDQRNAPSKSIAFLLRFLPVFFQQFVPLSFLCCL